jgi:hypothetical protein
VNPQKFLQIRISQVIPKRREALIGVIGNAFSSAPPFQNLPVIDDKSGERIVFHFNGLLPGKLFWTTGALDFTDDGLKTRVLISMNVTGLLASVYAQSWIVLLGLWLIESSWTSLFSSSLSSPLVQSWVVMLFVIWPLALFWILRRRLKQRMAAYLHNLVFHT